MKQGGICVCYPDQPRAALNMLKITAACDENRLGIASLNDLMLVEASVDGTQLLWKNGIPVRIAMAGEHGVKKCGYRRFLSLRSPQPGLADFQTRLSKREWRRPARRQGWRCFPEIRSSY